MKFAIVGALCLGLTMAAESIDLSADAFAR